MAEFATIALGTLGALIFKDHIENAEVVSPINNKKYRVLKRENYIDAANTLAALEDRARSFIAEASTKYPNDVTLNRIQKYWTGTISEIPQTETIAYALEKKDLFMCVRDNNGNIQNIDDLLFVLLHELSHIMNLSYGHDERFWKQFKKVLEMANELGYLPYENYDKKSVMVCGKEITSNPATCVFNGSCSSELLRPLRPT